MKRFGYLLFVMLPVFGCGTTQRTETPFAQANQLMGEEIDSRISQIPYQHREQLYNNLLWLQQAGEQAIPSLLKGLKHDEPKVRSSCAWVIGQIGDKRAIPALQPLMSDKSESVRLEVARSLVDMGDVKYCPVLIEALDHEKVHVRGMCHEALKKSTGRDFGYDHLTDNTTQRKSAALRWRQWWATQSGDEFFAQSYAQQNSLGAFAAPAAPLGETNKPKPQDKTEKPAPATRPSTLPAPVVDTPKKK